MRFTVASLACYAGLALMSTGAFAQQSVGPNDKKQEEQRARALMEQLGRGHVSSVVAGVELMSAGQESAPSVAPGDKKPQEEQEPTQEKDLRAAKDFVEELGLGHISAFIRTRAATRLHDRQVSSTKESEKGDLAQHENTFWLEWSYNKLFALDWLEAKVIGRVIYDSAFEFNNDIDVDPARDELETDPDLREGYFNLNFESLSFRVGKQMVVWGESDIFRVNDWANPTDIRRGFFGDLEELREPLWMVSARYGGMDWGVEAVWNPGDFQDELVAPEGAEFYPDEAWAKLRERTARKVNGATRAALLPLLGPLTPAEPVPAANFTYVNLEHERHRELANGEGGLRVRTQIGDWDVSLMYFNTISDRPVLETKGTVVDFGPGPPPGNILSTSDNTATITTNITWRRLNVAGASFSKDVEMGVLRGEVGWSIGEYFTKSGPSGLELTQKNALRWVIGFDRPTFIPLIAEDRTATLSVQVWQQWVPDAEDDDIVEVPFQKEVKTLETAFSFIAQLAYLEDRLQPQFVWTRDLKGAQLFSAKIDYKVNNAWRITVAGSFFDGPGDHGFGVFDARDQVSFGITYVY